MLRSITVKKEIYTGETTQICVCLLIRQPMLLSKSADTSHDIFNPVKYFFLIHNNSIN